jgi:predicted RND superfamily exporter protein
VEVLKKHKKKIVVLVLGGLLYAGAQFLGVDVDLGSVFGGDLSALGEALEAAPSE